MRFSLLSSLPLLVLVLGIFEHANEPEQETLLMRWWGNAYSPES